VTTADDRGVLSNEELVQAGWVRRHLADLERAREAQATYRDAGFEVRLETLSPGNFADECRTCAASVCPSYVVVYTRKTSGDP